MSLNCNTDMCNAPGKTSKMAFKALLDKGFRVWDGVGQGLPLLTIEIVGSKPKRCGPSAYVGMPNLCQAGQAGESGNKKGA
jgi:hypothetical protein